MNGELTRNFLVNAYDLDMNNGEYVFIGIELVKSSNDFSWYKVGDKNNKKAKAIYESYLSLSVRVPTSSEYNIFVSDVFKRANLEFQNININHVSNQANASSSSHSKGLYSQINPLVAAFYDCIILYAYAYNRSLSSTDTGMSRNSLVTQYLWNNIFPDGK